MISKDKLLNFYNLKNIIRYNMRYKIQTESVAEHSYFVALFTMMICDELGLDQTARNECLTFAICHDLPETEVSDLPHPIKDSLPGLREVLNKAEMEYMRKELPVYADNFKKFQNPCNEYELYFLIVKLADIISVLQFTYLETELGNKTFDDILTHATNRYYIAIGKIKTITGHEITLFKEIVNAGQ